MKVLIGSQALHIHRRLKHRDAYDWDFLTDEEMSQQPNLEIHSLNTKTSEQLFEKSIKFNTIIKTPFGEAYLAPLEVLKVLKISSLPLKRHKHKIDLKELEDIQLSKEYTKIAEDRLLETKKRIEKDNFFHQYNIKRSFEHDYLHSLINPNPMYKKILNEDSSVIGSKAKFLALSKENKRELILEEIFVFSLERNLIPQIQQSPTAIFAILEVFQNTKYSEAPFQLWLNRFATEDQVKRNPKYISKWIQENYAFFHHDIEIWWNTKTEMLPENFWKELL